MHSNRVISHGMHTGFHSGRSPGLRTPDFTLCGEEIVRIVGSRNSILIKFPFPLSSPDFTYFNYLCICMRL